MAVTVVKDGKEYNASLKQLPDYSCEIKVVDPQTDEEVALFAGSDKDHTYNQLTHAGYKVKH
jgi:hypothetical protein